MIMMTLSKWPRSDWARRRWGWKAPLIPGRKSDSYKNQSASPCLWCGGSTQLQAPRAVCALRLALSSLSGGGCYTELWVPEPEWWWFWGFRMAEKCLSPLSWESCLPLGRERHCYPPTSPQRDNRVTPIRSSMDAQEVSFIIITHTPSSPSPQPHLNIDENKQTSTPAEPHFVITDPCAQHICCVILDQ